MDNVLSPILGSSQPSAQAQANAIARQIVDLVPQSVRQMMQARSAGYKAFWNTPGVPPQLIAAAMGAKAVSAFTEDAAAIAFLGSRLKAAGMTDDQIKQLLPGVPDGYTATPNADGTVTIGVKS